MKHITSDDKTRQAFQKKHKMIINMIKLEHIDNESVVVVVVVVLL